MGGERSFTMAAEIFIFLICYQPQPASTSLNKPRFDSLAVVNRRGFLTADGRGWTQILECADKSALLAGATGRPGQKRRSREGGTLRNASARRRGGGSSIRHGFAP
jgi:hypothetical protein